MRFQMKYIREKDMATALTISRFVYLSLRSIFPLIFETFALLFRLIGWPDFAALLYRIALAVILRLNMSNK